MEVWIHDIFLPWNVIKIKTLPRSWIDRDEVLLHASFQILVDYVEGEDPFGVCGWDNSPDIAKEIKDLYNWWKVERKRTGPPWHWEEWTVEDQQMLHRLIDIREHLWT